MVEMNNNVPVPGMCRGPQNRWDCGTRCRTEKLVAFFYIFWNRFSLEQNVILSFWVTLAELKFFLKIAILAINNSSLPWFALYVDPKGKPASPEGIQRLIHDQIGPALHHFGTLDIEAL